MTTTAEEPLGGALARLEARWGSAAVRLGNGGQPSATTATLGALALAPMPDLEPDTAPSPTPTPATEVVSTGFPELDALLGTGGLPRRASATLRGDASSGKTTLALRTVASAQAVGGIVAWLDVGRTFDPLEAAARGVDLRWLVVLRPTGTGEGLRMAGALVSGRAVDLLVVDLPPRLAPVHEGLIRRLAAHARRIGVQVLVLEPLDLAAPLHSALAEAAGLRLELERVDWLRLGRDVVGQRTVVTVAKHRSGPPGRSLELEIRYLDDGERDAGVGRLLAATGPPAPLARPIQKPPTELVTIDHAPAPLRLAKPATPPRARSTRPALDTGDAARPGRPTVGSGHRPRSQPGRGALRRSAGAAAGGGAPARP
ncbi:MAG TPA: hypothetical protein VIF84_10230 [Candidatus Limnocylindrales bacterium]|jgi:recombination protein RecA